MSICVNLRIYVMDQNSVYTVLITIVTVLSSASAWRYYEKRAENKEKSENYIKDELKNRISKLETSLEKELKDKSDLNAEILRLTGEVSSLRTKCEFLEKEIRSMTNHPPRNR